MALVDEALRLSQLGFHPIVERPNSKLPVEPAWQKAIGRGEAELRAVFSYAPEGAGIGTVTGDGLVVVDCDVRPEYSGLDSLAALPPLPPTLTSRTPSGGCHLFFSVPRDVVVKNSVGKVGVGIDIRGQGGQVVLPPTVIDGKPYAWVDGSQAIAPLPEAWLSLVAEPAVATPALDLRPPPALRVIRAPGEEGRDARRRRAVMDALEEPSVQGQGGNGPFMRAARAAVRMSRTEAEALEALASWNERMATPPWSEQDMARAIRNTDATMGEGLDRDREAESQALATGPSAPPAAPARPADDQNAPVAWVKSMQAFVARLPDGSWELTNPLSVQAAKLALVSSGVPAKRAQRLLADGGVPLADYVNCDPSQGPMFRDANGRLVLNTYIPPTIKPCAGPFPVLDEMLGFLTCDDPAGKAWLTNWLAFAAQNPARMQRTVPVFYGAQRTGKSTLARVLKTIIGEANSTSIRNEDIKSKFTSHFVNKLFVTVGEIEASEVGHATSTLKYLTGEDSLKFEAKGANAFDVPNRIKMMATSNQTLPVTVEGEGDSRWVLFKQLVKPPESYTSKLDSLFDQKTNDWSDKGRAEVAALAAYLLAYPLDVALARSVYSNGARDAAVEASRSSVEQFIEALRSTSLDAVFLANVPEHERLAPCFQYLDIPGHPELSGFAAVYGVYRAFCRQSGLQALGTGRFPQEMERHAHEWTRRKLPTSVMAARPNVYEGIPRQQEMRADRIPWSSKQLPLSPQPNPSAERARELLQREFGELVEEEEP